MRYLDRVAHQGFLRNTWTMTYDRLVLPFETEMQSDWFQRTRNRAKWESSFAAGVVLGVTVNYGVDAVVRGDSA